MGTGVGEAMLIGAAVGGGSSALTGGDPIKGAMMGAATGAIGGAFAAPGFDPTALAGATEAGSIAGTSSLNAAIDPGLASISTMTPQAVSQGVSSGAIPIEAANQYGQSFSQAFEGIKPISPNVTGFSPLSNTQLGLIGGGAALSGLMEQERNKFGVPGQEDYVSSFDASKFRRSEPTYAPEGVYRPEYKSYAAEGGIMRLAVGGSVDDELGGDYSAMGMDQGNMQKGLFGLGYGKGGITEILEAAKAQGLSPEAYQQIYGRGNALQEMQKALKEGKMVNGLAQGGISSLGGYSDGGRMLRGPGDGMSDSIPGVIANKQPARLADGEFVVPADVVSHLGNGSTDAGAKRLYSMMDKVRKARTGTKKQGKQINPNRFMPA